MQKGSPPSGNLEQCRIAHFSQTVDLPETKNKAIKIHKIKEKSRLLLRVKFKNRCLYKLLYYIKS